MVSLIKMGFDTIQEERTMLKSCQGFLFQQEQVFLLSTVLNQSLLLPISIV